MLAWAPRGSGMRAVRKLREARSLRALLLLRQIDRLALENMQQGLGRLQDLHVRSLGLLDGLVVLVASLRLAHEALVNLLKPVSEDGELLLDFRLVLLLLQNLAV